MRDIQAGDRLVRSKGFLIEHCGTAVGWSGGVLYVAHNMPARGYVVDSYADFLGGGALLRVSRPPDARAVLTRVREDLGKPYDLFLHNCQHACTRAATGRPSSWQLPLLAGAAAFAVVGIVALATSK